MWAHSLDVLDTVVAVVAAVGCCFVYFVNEYIRLCAHAPATRRNATLAASAWVLLWMNAKILFRVGLLHVSDVNWRYVCLFVFAFFVACFFFSIAEVRIKSIEYPKSRVKLMINRQTANNKKMKTTNDLFDTSW